MEKLLLRQHSKLTNDGTKEYVEPPTVRTGDFKINEGGQQQEVKGDGNNPIMEEKKKEEAGSDAEDEEAEPEGEEEDEDEEMEHDGEKEEDKKEKMEW
uniref:Uncharacterized protein n=1 Tax=Panagrolaimus davidi TaxID=227884 RepID=A0A914QKA7_9BILA